MINLKKLEVIDNKTNCEKIPHVLICRTFSGGKDLYHGIPDLNGAIVVDIIPECTEDEYVTNIVLQNKDNSKVLIRVLQER